MKLKSNVILLTMILLVVSVCTFSVHIAKAADSLSVVNISTADKPGYTVYWPKDKGIAKLERAKESGNFEQIAETDLNFYADFSVEKGIKYIYKVTYAGNALTATTSDILTGRPTISSIKIESGAISAAEASVIINFRTDRLSKNQIFYGTSMSYESQTEQSADLNQSHTILIEKLKPNTTYHFKIRTSDKTDKNSTESDDQVFTTPIAPPDQSLLEIIIQALTRAFAGFEKWLKS